MHGDQRQNPFMCLNWKKKMIMILNHLSLYFSIFYEIVAFSPCCNKADSGLDLIGWFVNNGKIRSLNILNITFVWMDPDVHILYNTYIKWEPEN